MRMFQQIRLTTVALLTLEAAITVSATTLPPQPDSPDLKKGGASLAPASIPLLRRALPPQTKEEWGQWAYAHKQALNQKYGKGGEKRRSSGTNRIVNQNADSSYYGSVIIGTPPTAYNVILDTGSSDFWVADSNCIAGCSSIRTFDASDSSTFQNLSIPFQIQYGSGDAQGSLAQDVVQMAGFSIPNQVFATCDVISSGLLQSPVSGLMGLGFESIAASRAMPFWQTLASQGALDEPLMAFHLTRFANVSDARVSEPGGSFDLGFTNSSLYTGVIDYVDLPTQGSYWLLSLTTLNVNSNSVSLPSRDSAYAAIDTGTTLVGGPPAVIRRLYDQIPDSEPGSGDFEDYYTYPCDTPVTVQLGFGNSDRTWSISPSDFSLGEVERGTCLGAFFRLSESSSTPPWIIGDTFLKNVYSVFRYQPASVGFAELSDVAVDQSGIRASIPSPTIASPAATVSATATTRASSGAPGGAFRSRGGAGKMVIVVWLAFMLIEMIV